MKASNFILYYSQWPALKSLSVQELGELLQAIFRTLGDEDVEDVANSLSEKVQIAFRFLMVQIKYDNEKYQKKCEKNKQNAMKRWSKNANDATAFFAMPNNNNNSNNNSNSNNNNNNKNSSKAAIDINNNNGKAVKEAAAADKEFFEKAKKEWLPWFNQLLSKYESKIPVIRVMTPQRAKRLQEILNTYGSEALAEVCRRAAASQFLNGKGTKNRFVANFDWLLDEKNFLKIYEGYYNV